MKTLEQYEAEGEAEDNFNDAFEKYLDETYYHIEEDEYYNDESIFTVDWEHVEWDGESYINYKAVKRFKFVLFGLEFETEITTDIGEVVENLCNTIADEYPSSNNWNVEEVAAFNLQKILQINTTKALEILRKHWESNNEK
jgi:hypothetical protein